MESAHGGNHHQAQIMSLFAEDCEALMAESTISLAGNTMSLVESTMSLVESTMSLVVFSVLSEAAIKLIRLKNIGEAS